MRKKYILTESQYELAVKRKLPCFSEFLNGVENGEIDYEYYREKASRESSEQFAMMFVYDMLIYCQVNPEEISIKDLIPLVNFFKGRVMKIYYLLKD
jgi:hypothetical protein